MKPFTFSQRDGGKPIHLLSKSQQNNRVAAYLETLKYSNGEGLSLNSSSEEGYSSSETQMVKTQQEIRPALHPFPLSILDLPVQLPLKTENDVYLMEQWIKHDLNYYYLFEYIRRRINSFDDMVAIFFEFLSETILDEYTLASTRPYFAKKDRKWVKPLTILYGIWIEVAETSLVHMRKSTAVSKCYQRARGRIYAWKRRMEQKMMQQKVAQDNDQGQQQQPATSASSSPTVLG